MSAPRILMLHGNSEDYSTDSLMHGLRLVLGEQLVEVPRRDGMYDDLTPEQRGRMYGRGFTLYGRLPDVDVKRSWWLNDALDGQFDVIVFPDIWRFWGAWLQLRPYLGLLRSKGVTLAAVDGGDGTALFPHGPTWWFRWRPWPIPKVAGRIHVFKREMAPQTAWMRSYGVVPPPVAERLLLRGVRSLAFAIPEDLLATGDEPKTKLLGTHVVDPDIVALMPGEARITYAFDDEAAYYGDLRASKFGITTKKAGWETLRHYEIAASGCVPCFRDLHRKPARTAPFGLDETNCVIYTDPRQLLDRIRAMGDDEYARLRAGALAWARRNTTRARAHEFLAAIGRPQDPSQDAMPLAPAAVAAA